MHHVFVCMQMNASIAKSVEEATTMLRTTNEVLAALEKKAASGTAPARPAAPPHSRPSALHPPAKPSADDSLATAGDID